jgi:uncharacterized protein (TIGR03067 family)
VIGTNVDATAVAADLAALAGTWVYERHVVNGKEITAEQMANDFITIRGNSLIRKVRSPDGQPLGPADLSTVVSTIRIDPTVTPKRLDDHQSQLVRPALGIYQLEGDRLTLCWSNASPERPTTFDSPEGSPFVLSVLRRQSK